MDKGYYDYDYEKPSDRTVAAIHSAKSNDELASRLARMGLKVKPTKPLTAEEAQQVVMAELKKAKQDGLT